MSDRWVHGFDDWLWSEQLNCWCHPPGYWCLGNRMFHESFGANVGDVVYHGSYTDDWHGGIQTDSWDEALAWLHNATGEGHELW